MLSHLTPQFICTTFISSHNSPELFRDQDQMELLKVGANVVYKEQKLSVVLARVERKPIGV